jgi:hypothetical protein
MKRMLALPLLTLLACGGHNVQTDYQSLECSGGEVPVFSNRFVPQPGGSGVATGADAAAGMINSSGPSGGGVAGGAAGPGAPTSGAPTSGAPAGDDGGPLTAMTVACGQAMCAPGQVAVEVPPVVTGGPIGAPTTGAPTAGGAASSGAAGVGDSVGTPAPPQLMPPGTIVCTDPPPPCPAGQSPQYTSKQTWECTDCSLVVTYGGQYGNYRRCVSTPHLDCPNGQVPTWVFEDEQWECKPTCDNGQYDQHMIQGQLVCVPC